MDAGMIGMTRDAIVGHTAGHPHGPLAGLALAYHLHDPGMVGIGYRKRFAAGGIAIAVDQRDHGVESRIGGLGALQGDVDQRAIVDGTRALELRASAPCRLRDGQAMLIHIAVGGKCVGNLGNLAQRLAGVPLHHLAHSARRMIGCRLMVELTVESVGVGGIRRDHRSVDRSLLARNKIGARQRGRHRERHRRHRRGYALKAKSIHRFSDS